MSILKNEWTNDFYGRLDLKINHGMQSIAGYGSYTWNTRIIVAELPRIFKQYDIKTMLDIPCGDYYWMKEVDLDNITYIGGDLVNEQIKLNQDEHPSVDFRVMDMIKDDLPYADLVFTRDCLVHLTYENISIFINKLINNGSKYIMSTTFPETELNTELVGIIGWRPLNLEVYPINFPMALEIISEKSDYNPEKCMGIWSLQDIKNSI
jgi:hypothetical protein